MDGPDTLLLLDALPDDPIAAATLAGIRRYAAARGWTAEAASPGEGDRAGGLRRLLAERRPAGCVVECATGRADLPPRLFGRVPVVYLHPPPGLYGAGATRLSNDNEAIARLAFRELSAWRPAAYATVGVREGFAWSRARTRAFMDLARAAGAPCRAFPTRRVETREGRDARLARWLARLPRKTAVFAVNDFAAAAVVGMARVAGRKIPRDLAVLGADDNAAVCETMSPAISSVRIDAERAGFLAARALGEMVSGAPPPRDCVAIPPLLAVRRRSTGGAGRREPFVLRAVETIRREACDGLTAADLAARSRRSRWLFEMRFREATGRSVLDEILHVRLEKAETLLARTDTPVGAIAAFCGFRTEVALRKLFRSRTGMSMTEFRRRARR